MRKLLIILAAMVALSSGHAVAQTAYTVPIGSQALVLQGDQIVRKEEPGLRFYDPETETLVIESVFQERRFTFDAPFDVQGCAADFVLTYRIGDLEAYYLGGRDLSALGAMEGDIATAINGLPERAVTRDGEKTYVRGFSAQFAPLNGDVAGGLSIIRVDVSLADGCVPKSVVREIPVDATIPATVGVLADQRTAVPVLRFATADGAELQIDGFVPTFLVDDQDAVETCFGQNPDAATLWAANRTTRILYDVVQDLNLDQLGEISERLPALLHAADYAQCGMTAGGIDFSAATFTQRVVVACEEAPEGLCDPESGDKRRYP